jgi:glycosyltransferase involved in cell wall biosynthesis
VPFKELILAGDPRWVLAVYTVLVLVHLSFQQWCAHWAARALPGAPPRPPSRPVPAVDVIVPCYNEDPALLDACCRSLAGQRYDGGLRVWLVDDGSPNRAELEPVYRRYEHRRGWRVLRLPGNVGKRRAQDAAFAQGAGELVVTIDSDTTVAPDGIAAIALPLRHDLEERVGAVTGCVRASNREANLLTRLVDVRYRVMFERERAAQGSVSAVLCCSGPFAVYRRSALERVWTAYLAQRQWGRDCIFGDDLHLTNLLLAKRYRSLYAQAAKAETSVPATLRGFARQQVRWNKSFYRELPWTLEALRGCLERPWYPALDVFARLVAPALLALGLGLAAAQVVAAGPGQAVRLLPVLGALVLTHLVFVLWQTGDPRFFLLYGLLFVGLLLPVRAWATLTLRNNRWGTRNHHRRWLRGMARQARFRGEGAGR